MIRPGVTVAGLDVGGQTLSQAAGTIDRAYRHQLVTRNVSVRVGGKAYSLRTKKVAFVFDPAKSARRAYIAGNDTPAPQPVDVLPWTSYDKKKLAAFVARVDRSRPRRPAQRHRAHHAPAHPQATLQERPRAGREGPREGARRSRWPTRARRARCARSARSSGPRCASKDLESRYGTVVTISKSSFRLRLFKRLKFVKSYGVAVGQPAYPTPSGLFSIANKAVNPPWTAPNSPWAGAYRNETVAGGSAENPLKARWMGIVNGVGIHGTGEPGSIGTRASHGCIRMTVPDVIDLYPRVPVGTPVLIQ